MYKIFFEKRAVKSIKSLPFSLRNRITLALKDLSLNPRPQGSVKLSGSFKDYWRIRVGDYRVVFEINDDKSS
jgi:mRNA interferase RelE/StbE